MRLLLLVGLTGLASACATISVPRYSNSPEVAGVLRDLHTKHPHAQVRVGMLSLYLDDPREVSCAAGVGIHPPDSQTFAQYLSGALAQELVAAGFAEAATVTVSGELQTLELARIGGAWHLKGTVRMGSAPLLHVDATTHFPTGFLESSTCPNAAAAMVDLAQGLAKQVFSSREFEQALSQGSPDNT